MKRFASIALAFFAALVSTGAHAADTFDLSSKLLTLQSVTVGSQVFSNANVTIGSYSQLSVAGGVAVAESFYPATNFLTLGTVVAGGLAYKNVRLTVYA